MVKTLTMAGANPRDYSLWDAAKEGHVEIAKILVTAGADTKRLFRSLFEHWQTRTPEKLEVLEKSIKTLVAGVDMNDEAICGNSTLLTVANQFDTEGVKILIAAGIRVRAETVEEFVDQIPKLLDPWNRMHQVSRNQEEEEKKAARDIEILLRNAYQKNLN